MSQFELVSDFGMTGDQPEAVAKLADGLRRGFRHQTLLGVTGSGKKTLAIGRAQAIAILAAANKGIPASEYTPAQIKQRVANYGASSKEQIQEMVRLQLGLPETPQPSDAADALAVALCHLSEIHLSNLLSRQQ